MKFTLGMIEGDEINEIDEWGLLRGAPGQAGYGKRSFRAIEVVSNAQANRKSE